MAYLSRWSRLDILNLVRELARYVSNTNHDPLQSNDKMYGILPNYKVQWIGIEIQHEVEWRARHEVHY